MVWKMPRKNQVKHACDKDLAIASLTRALDQTGIASANAVCNSPMTLKAEDKVVDITQVEAERKRAMGIMYSRQTAYR